MEDDRVMSERGRQAAVVEVAPWQDCRVGAWGSALISEKRRAALRVPNYSCCCGQLK